MKTTIRACFKQTTMKSGVAVLQFEILTDDAKAFEIIKHSGEYLFLSIEPEQETITFTDGDVVM